MENVYSQTENERNSIVELPEGLPENLGNTLMSWLGSFWREVVKDNSMIRGMQGARGYVLAQRYLDLVEALRLQDRNNAPVFHRELWHPIVIRRSQRNASQENLLSMGENGIVFGPQEAGSIYGEGTILHVGKLGEFEKYVTYPVVDGGDIRGMSSAIVDNFLNPTVSLQTGIDFVFRNGTLIFPKSGDPFGENSGFCVYDVPSASTDDPADSDLETVLWASDVLLDRNYIADHVSYPIGANAPSISEVKRIINAAWDAISCGLTPEACSTLVAAMLNIPVIQTDKETVVDISTSGDDGYILVRTDKNSYKVSQKSRLRGCVKSGAVLNKGQFLDESVRIYPMLTNPDVEHISAITGFSTPVDEDLPSITIPPSILKVGTKYGIYVTWGEVPVKKNADGRYYFDVGGQASDVKAFWDGIWREADSNGVDLSSVIGEEGSMISPAKFFLRNLVGANTLVITMDRNRLDDISMMRDPMFFGMLCNVVPSAIRLMFIEHRSIKGEDLADLGGVNENTCLFAALRPSPDVVENRTDMVRMRLFRPAPKKVMHRKD